MVELIGRQRFFQATNIFREFIDRPVDWIRGINQLAGGAVQRNLRPEISQQIRSFSGKIVRSLYSREGLGICHLRQRSEFQFFVEFDFGLNWIGQSVTCAEPGKPFVRLGQSGRNRMVEINSKAAVGSAEHGYRYVVQAEESLVCSVRGLIACM